MEEYNGTTASFLKGVMYLNGKLVTSLVAVVIDGILARILC
jgi:hypothetical protein